MKKLLLLSIFSLSLTLNAQTESSPTNETGASNWTFGGSAGLGGTFGSGNSGTSVYLSPRVGYKITPDLEGGLATNFTWSNSEYFSATTFGVGPYLNYYIARNFYLSGMFQEYFFNQRNKFTDQKYSGDEAALYLGGGYMQKIGERAYLQIGGMYNVLYDKENSVFGSGFIPSIGVVLGL